MAWRILLVVVNFVMSLAGEERVSERKEGSCLP